MGIRELNVDLTEEHTALRDAARKFLGEVWRLASIALDKLSDPRAAMIEDGANEVLALGGADRLLSAKVRGEN